MHRSAYHSTIAPQLYRVLVGYQIHFPVHLLMMLQDWTMFAAASVTNSTISNQLVSGIHAYASVHTEPHSNYPFVVVYDINTAAEMAITSSGSNVGGINRCVVLIQDYPRRETNLNEGAVLLKGRCLRPWLLGNCVHYTYMYMRARF